MDAKKVFEEFKPKLVRLLPLKDPLFNAELTHQNLFSGNLKEEVMEARTKADAADRFLDEAVERPLNVGYKEPFDKLLLVMEKFDNNPLRRLAGEINQKFRNDLAGVDKWMSLEEQRRVLSENCDFLINYLDPDDIIAELFQAHIIGRHAMQQLQVLGMSRRNKSQIIVDQLNTAAPGSLEKFCNILKKGGRQTYIADQIEKSLPITANNKSVRQLMPTTSLDVSKLRARYMSTVYTDWPQHYVQLALVKEERGTRSDKDIEEIAKLTLRGQIDEVLLRKEPLHDLNDIFHYQNKPCPRIILIVGGPGMGKTTLANKLCEKWASEGFLAKDFDAVILIPLKLTQQRSLEEVIIEHTGEEMYQKIKQSNGNRCLIILEGLDEMAWQTDTFFARLIFRSTIFEMATIIITSRPHTCDKIVSGRRIELIGFSKDKVIEFANKSLLNDGKDFLQQLEEYSHLQGLCYVPMNLTMMIEIFYYNERNLPSTVTELYQLFIIKILQRQVQKNTENFIYTPYSPVAVAAIATSNNVAEEKLCKILVGIPKETVGTVLLLSKLAYHGLYEWHTKSERKPWINKKWIDPKVVFTVEDLTQYGINLTNQFDGFGLLKATCTYHMPTNACTYNFPHLTIQEFLCAVYIAMLPPEELEIILRDSYQDYPSVFVFLCGLLRLISADHKIFRMIYSQLTSNCRKAITAVKCAFESQQDGMLQPTTPFALSVNLNTLLPYDCMCISYVLSHYPVSQLNMWGCLMGQKGAELLVKHCPQKKLSVNLLQKLNLYGNNLTADGLVHVMKIINSNNFTLVELDVGGNSIGDDGILLLCEGLRQNTVINEFRIQKSGISKKGAEHIRDLLKVTYSLKSLDMSHNSVGDDGISVILKELQHNNILTRFTIENCGLSEEGAVHISEMLSSNQALQILEMGQNNIGDDGISVIIKKLQYSSNLIKLRMQKCGLSSEGIIHIHEMLVKNRPLQVLDFEGNSIGDDGISQISRGLYENTNLTELWIQRCAISTPGAVYLSKVLTVNNILQILNLCGNNIGDNGITAIAEALQHNTSIMALYVRGCGITFSGAKSLAEALKINHVIKKLRIADNFVTVEGAKLILQSAVNNGVCQEVWINDEYQSDSNVKKLMGIIEDGKAKKLVPQCKWK